MLMGSGNDCAEILAAAFKGGPEGLVEEMNKKAMAMGNHRTVFYTASGLDKKTSEKKEGEGSVKIDSNMSTAREMAQIARAAFADETIRPICQKRTHLISDTKFGHTYMVRNTNKLLRDKLPIEGGKTGFTCRAGHCLASKFAAGGSALLIVVLGSPDHFRDTRLVYRKAVEKAGAPDIKHRSRPTHHAQRGSKEFGG
jgi:D-alanyl-D-alanine carboxypeptidase